MVVVGFGGRGGPPEVLGDRAGGHEAGGVAGAHLGAVVRQRQQQRDVVAVGQIGVGIGAAASATPCADPSRAPHRHGRGSSLPRWRRLSGPKAQPWRPRRRGRGQDRSSPARPSPQHRQHDPGLVLHGLHRRTAHRVLLQIRDKQNPVSRTLTRNTTANPPNSGPRQNAGAVGLRSVETACASAPLRVGAPAPAWRRGSSSGRELIRR